MVDSPYFKTNFLNLTKDLNQETSSRDSFTIFMCVGGIATIETAEGKVDVQKGETVLVPALTNEIRIKTTGAKLLEVTI